MPSFDRRQLLLSGLALNSLTLAEAGFSASPSRALKPTQSRASVTTPHSEQFNLKSDTGREFVIQVGLPHDVDPDLPLMVRGRKPVTVYVLDGESSFGMVCDLTRMMQWGGDVPPCLVVGITYPSKFLEHPTADQIDPRDFDLTPTPQAGLAEFSGARDSGGGGHDFLSFIESGLAPLIHERYGSDPSISVLVGHSLGGLFTIGAATQNHGKLLHFLALSPSLWWDDRFELKRFETALKGGLHRPGRLAVFVGEREERISGVAAAMVGNVVSLQGVLDNFPLAFDKTLVQILPDEDHHTLHGTSISRGLRFLLN